MKYNPSLRYGQARSGFAWQPDCRVLGREQFKVNFTVSETTCQPAATQEV